MKAYVGSTWTEKPTKAWSGSAWVVHPVKVWDGSAWVIKPSVPTGPTGPPITTGLTVWLDASQLTLADGAAVSPWPNEVVAGPSSTMVGTPVPVFATGVLNGLPVVRFTANEGRLRMTSTGITNNYTVAYVARLRDSVPGRVLTTYYPTANNWLLGFWNGYQDVAYDGGFFTPDMRTTQTTNWKLYSADGVSGTQRLFSNGTYLSSGYGAGFGGVLHLGGYDATAAAETPNADVAELVLYDHQLSDSDRVSVEDYIRTKWGLP